jgi:hypothetical protein
LNLVPCRHPIGSNPSVACFAIVAARADGRLSHATSTAEVEEALSANVDDKPLDEQALRANKGSN